MIVLNNKLHKGESEFSWLEKTLKGDVNKNIYLETSALEAEDLAAGSQGMCNALRNGFRECQSAQQQLSPSSTETILRNVAEDRASSHGVGID